MRNEGMRLGHRRGRFAALIWGLALACGPGMEPAPEAPRIPEEQSIRRGVGAMSLEDEGPADAPGDRDEGDTGNGGDAGEVEPPVVAANEAALRFQATCPSSQTPPVGATRYVANTGPRDPSKPLGSSDNPYPTISAAVRASFPGDLIQVRSGTYAEQIAITPEKGARSGTLSAPIILRGDTTNKPRIVPTATNVGSLVMVSQPYWIVQSLEVDVQERPSFAVLFQNATFCSQILDSRLHGGRAGGGVIASNAETVLVQGNAIYDFSKTGTDSHGVAVKGTTREVFVLENDIHDASGDAVQCQPDAGNRPSGLYVERNQLHDCGENGIDIKACDNISVNTNTIYSFPNLESFPWQANSSAAEAVLVHEDATNIQIVANRISVAGRGISIGGTSAVDNPVNVTLSNNTVTDIFNFANRGNGQGIRIVKANKVRVLGNTIERTVGEGLRLAADEPLIVTGLSVFDNTLRNINFFVKLGRPQYRPGLQMDRNRYEGPDGKFSCFGILAEGDFTVWRNRLAPYGLEQSSVKITPSTPGPLPALVGE
ncbi:right-handed parallel beta-helix repeat-containing protein [Myxococcus sp. K15C18031901]|uniref:right-handed parallel beta-helix repeat-containing protein n=1 Tax=Myxococcus dinghuensis TaxID=2906761 RepID=UPI0020A78BDF|nr:right-handed parallel beta-helix repeat-containing protein [Myxococcus dinghuensis]MCP3101309.1 right-handed parallel beta-helix repeat-containing protein [Myxococcus dinghuensis]